MYDPFELMGGRPALVTVGTQSAVCTEPRVPVAVLPGAGKCGTGGKFLHLLLCSRCTLNGLILHSDSARFVFFLSKQKVWSRYSVVFFGCWLLAGSLRMNRGFISDCNSWPCGRFRMQTGEFAGVTMRPIEGSALNGLHLI